VRPEGLCHGSMFRDTIKWAPVSARYAASRMVLANDKGPCEGGRTEGNKTGHARSFICLGD
jgi:hypothetical protein